MLQFMRPNDKALAPLGRSLRYGAPIFPRMIGGFPSGQCYWNCDQYVAEHGGEIVYGWQVLFWPTLFIELLHHAVVRSEDGRIVDPTNPEIPCGEQCVVFPDNSHIPARDYPDYLTNQFFFPPPGPVPAAKEYADAHCEMVRAKRALVYSVRKEGKPFVLGQIMQVPAHLAMAINAAQDAIDAASESCRQAMEENLNRIGRGDSVPSTG